MRYELLYVAMHWAKIILLTKVSLKKNVNKASNSTVTNKCDTVNGVSCDASVAEMWKVSFEKLYNMNIATKVS